MREIDIVEISTEKERQKIIESNTSKKCLKLGIVYPSAFESAKVLRDFITDSSNAFGITNTWKSRLILIADELNNNAMEYGSKSGDLNVMRVRLQILPNSAIKVRLEVEDSGKGKQAKTAKQMEALRKQKQSYDFTHHESIRGRGLFLIISKLVNELYFKNSVGGGLVVGIKKEIVLGDIS